MSDPSSPSPRPDGHGPLEHDIVEHSPVENAGEDRRLPVDGEDRRRSRRLGLLLGVAVTVVVLAAAGVGVFFLLSGGETTESDPRTTSERFAELYQRELESGGTGALPAGFESVVCADDLGSVRAEVPPAAMDEQLQTPVKRIVVKDLRVDGDRGTVTLTAELSLPDGQTHGVDETLDLVTENGGWRVCGLHRVRDGA
jgi:hypothetical protein